MDDALTPAARVAAAIEVLDAIFDGRTAEQALSAWARGSRFAGSKDRAALRDLVYDALRCRGSAAAMGGALTGRGLMLGRGKALGWDMDEMFSGVGHAPDALTTAEAAHLATSPDMDAATSADMPQTLWPMWCESLGEEAIAVAKTLKSRAPLFLRVNRRRTKVADVVKSLADHGITTAPVADLPNALRVTKNERRVKTADAYRDGLVEIQDAASQRAMAQLSLSGRVLDYCAGGGGKALAVADMAAGAQVVAHDVNIGRTRDIGPRAARAGVQIDVVETDALVGLAPFDVVLCDAPCSGSGTWRRNPEAKWGATPENIHTFSDLQGEVIRNAARYAGPDGVLVYMTCSVFNAENGAVVTAFIADNPSWSLHATWQQNPGSDGDGFYQAVLRKTHPEVR